MPVARFHPRGRHRITLGLLILLCLTVMMPAHTQSLSAVSMRLSPLAPQRVSTIIQLTAIPTGGSNVEFKFLAGLPVNGRVNWQTLRNYGKASTIRWRPSIAGNYQITVYAREAGQKVDYQVRADQNYLIVVSLLTGVSLNLSPASPQPLLTTVTLTAIPSGAGDVQYRFSAGLKRADGSTDWQILRDFASASTWNWSPGTAGQYSLKVEARQGGDGTRVYTAEKPFTVNPVTGSAAQRYLAVARYRGNKAAALSFTFDDGLNTLLTHAVPLLDEFGFTGTFYVVPSWIPEHTPLPYPDAAASWDQWRSAAASGHEIGNHSMTHAILPPITDPAVLDAEINQSAWLIFTKIGRYPLTFAYPNNNWDVRIRDLVLVNHVAAREGCEEYSGSDFRAGDANAFVDDAINRGQWFVTLMHAIDDGGISPIPSSELRQHFQYVKAQAGRVWVETFGNVSLYTMERDHAALQLQALAQQGITFTLTCSLYDQVFNYPLTVMIATDPALTVTTASATRDGLAVPVTIVPGSLRVDVVPGASPITVTWER